MRQFLFLGFVPLFCLLLSSTACQTASSQTQTSQNSNSVTKFEDLWNAYPKERERIVITDYSDHFAMKWLRRDYRIADVVAHAGLSPL